MSRLDEIKARADAATPGPWLQDGPWWTDDGGPEPTALPCVVDVDRALVVFPPDATDVGMKRPEDRAANMAFITAAREDVPWLIERIGELSGAICWDTTCLNCASLLDSNYDQYMRAEIAEAEVERLTAERDALQVGRGRDRVKGATAVLNEELRTSEQEARARRAEAEVARLTALVQSTEDKADDYLAEIESAHAERDALHKREKSLANEVEWYKDRFPCDGVCVDAPEEACSRHGRTPEDLWRIIGEVAAERNALAAQVARVEEVLDHWRTVDEGNAAYAERIGERSRFADGLASRADMLRAALAGSEANTSDTQPTDQKVSDE